MKSVVLILLIVIKLTIAIESSREIEQEVKILKNEYNLTENGYLFKYHSSDGQKRSEIGTFLRLSVDGRPIEISIKGNYSYIYENEKHKVNFTSIDREEESIEGVKFDNKENNNDDNVLKDERIVSADGYFYE